MGCALSGCPAVLSHHIGTQEAARPGLPPYRVDEYLALCSGVFGRMGTLSPAFKASSMNPKDSDLSPDSI